MNKLIEKINKILKHAKGQIESIEYIVPEYYILGKNLKGRTVLKTDRQEQLIVTFKTDYYKLKNEL